MIIDDEEPARILLRKYVDMIDMLELVGESHSAAGAFDILMKQEVDLLFLDIQMPVLSGLDLLKSLSNPPKVILTTAYREYALEGYEFNVIDYLLKPISFNRFLKSIGHYQERVAASTIPEEIPDHIYVNINKTQQKIVLGDIHYIESLKDYVRVHTSKDKLVVKGNIGSFMKLIPDADFVRIHRSYIIRVDKITSYNQTFVHIGDVQLPIGKSYRGVLK